MPTKDDKVKEEEKTTTEEKPKAEAEKPAAVSSAEPPTPKPATEKPMEENKAGTTPADEEKPEEPTSTSTESETPKITSFSQLDTSKGGGAIAATTSEKSKDKNTEKEDEDKEREAPQPSGKEKISSDEVKEWLKDVRPDTSKEVEKKAGFNFKLFFTVFIIVLIIAAVVGGVFYYNQGVSENVSPVAQDSEEMTDQEMAMEETTEETSSEQVTPTVEDVNLSDYSVNILNGSGVAGEAGAVETLLDDLSLKSVDTGNADSYDYVTTEVSMKEGVPDAVYQKIKDALSESYTVEKSDTPLSEDSDYDVVITVGAKKN
jgi:uncharacterized protein (DUF2164 family)